jgi:hypothetical protein
MAESYSLDKKHRWPLWVLLAGITGIGNFVVGLCNLLNPAAMVYFWLVKFYGTTFVIASVLFPVSVIVVFIWFYQRSERTWLKATIFSMGFIALVICAWLAIGSNMFLTTTRIAGHIKQNTQSYYLLKRTDIYTVTFYFCESDQVGFSGHCKVIASEYGDNPIDFYVEQTTNQVTVKSKNPSFVWINTTPPTCDNEPPWSDEQTEIPGGCKE